MGIYKIKVLDSKGGSVFSYGKADSALNEWESNSFNTGDSYQKKYLSDMFAYLKKRYAGSKYKVICSKVIGADSSDIDELEKELNSVGEELDRSDFDPISLERGTYSVR